MERQRRGTGLCGRQRAPHNLVFGVGAEGGLGGVCRDEDRRRTRRRGRPPRRALQPADDDEPRGRSSVAGLPAGERERLLPGEEPIGLGACEPLPVGLDLHDPFLRGLTEKSAELSLRDSSGQRYLLEDRVRFLPTLQFRDVVSQPRRDEPDIPTDRLAVELVPMETERESRPAGRSQRHPVARAARRPRGCRPLCRSLLCHRGSLPAGVYRTW